MEKSRRESLSEIRHFSIIIKHHKGDSCLFLSLKTQKQKEEIVLVSDDFKMIIMWSYALSIIPFHTLICT